MTPQDFVKAKKLGMAERHGDKVDLIKQMIERFDLQVDWELESRSLDRLKQYNAEGKLLDKTHNLKKRLL